MTIIIIATIEIGRNVNGKLIVDTASDPYDESGIAIPNANRLLKINRITAIKKDFISIPPNDFTLLSVY
jgi:hypothetical protein